MGNAVARWAMWVGVHLAGACAQIPQPREGRQPRQGGTAQAREAQVEFHQVGQRIQGHQLCTWRSARQVMFPFAI